MTNRRILAAVLILFTAAFALTVFWASGEGGTVKYTLYIGLNDKDSYRQEIPTEEAEALVEGIILKYADGFTRILAKGAYTDGAGVVTFEDSLIYELLFTTEEQVSKIIDEVLAALNQDSVLVERQRVGAGFIGL
ncbi:MAG: DUF3574 domain-containing protein [Firmicutes bacterium]|nr:DUF3574 domain-containing protein [Bacillota bacterium]